MKSLSIARSAAAGAVAAASLLAGSAAATAATPQTAPRTAVVAHAGQRGAVVVALQSHLHALGYLHAQPSGHYGSLTRSAVAGFQRAHHLRITGVDDTRTDRAINAAFDADPHIGWVRSVTRTSSGWTMVVVKDHPCIIGDTSATCRGNMPTASDVRDVPTGAKVLHVTAAARVSVLHGSTPGAWRAFATSLAHGSLRGSTGYHPLVSWSYDGHGGVSSVQEQYRP